MSTSPEAPCPFCSVPDERVVERNAVAFVERDTFPLSAGHLLIIPRRHVASIFETTPEERFGLLDLLERAKALVDREHKPDGYNIGINDGRAAGQTIMHLPVHLIPRYKGDADDPRGGVRWIFPRKADYWNK